MVSDAEPKLQIRVIPVTPLQQNCSLIWNEATKNAALVDPGGDAQRLLDALDHFGLKLTRMWLTHGHLDHAGAAAELRERTGVAVEGPHKDDQFWLDQIEDNAKRYGVADLRNVTPDRYFEDGEELEFEGVRFGVAHTPGHTPGHVVIHNAALKIAFVGDVLFAGSIGRTDFPRGDHVPGHGPTSTFGRERQSNPFVADSLTGYGGAETHAPDVGTQRTTKRYT